MSDLVRTDVPSDFNAQMHMATVLAESSLLPAHLRGKPANVLVILGGARSLNVSAFWALQSMHVIEGKLSLSAELMRGLAIRAGHRVRIVKREADEAIVEIQRSDRDEPYRASFTWKEAVDAKLDNKDNWKKYRKAMLVARATSIAMRDECPDVLYGVVYTPDELGAQENDEGQIIDGETIDSAEVAMEAVEVDQAAIEQRALAVTVANPDQLAGLWVEANTLNILGAVLEGWDGGNLADQFLKRVRILLQQDQPLTDADLRALWQFASGAKLLDHRMVLRVGEGAADVKTVRDAILWRRDHPPVEPAEAVETVTEVLSGEVVDADEIDDAVNVPEDPDVVARQQAALDSWGDPT